MIAPTKEKQNTLDYNGHLSEANKEIKVVLDLIKHHNEISYKTLPLEYDSVKFKTKSHISEFMEQYLSAQNALTVINNAFALTNYSHDDIQMNVDRSIDYIIELFGSLSKLRDQMTKHISLVEFHMDRCIDSFMGITSLELKKFNDEELIEFIDKTYEQMNEQNLFIEYGSKLLSIMIRWLITSEKTQILEHITDLNYSLKKKITNRESIMTKMVHTNRLQRFGLVPDEGTNESFSNVIKRLFGLSIDFDDNSMITVEALERIIKILHADTGVSTGIVLIVSPNTNIYFNMTDLFKRKAPPMHQGITKDMIDRYELIEMYPTSNFVKKSQLIVVGKDIEVGYVLWTNDLKKFKWKSKTIGKKYLERIIRNTPSNIVQSINDMLDKALDTKHEDDIVEFNKVKNMAFNEKHTEQVFLDELVSNIFDIVKNHSNITKTTEKLFKVFENAKSNLVSNKNLNGHTQVIYASMAFDIINKIKYALISGNNLKNIADIRVIVCPNDNIYSRVMSSYYLHSSKN